MFTILFLIFIAIVLYPLVGLFLKMHRFKQDLNRAFGNRPSSSGNSGTPHGGRDYSTGGKVFGRDEGEYVDYEVVAEDSHDINEHDRREPDDSEPVYAESRVVDAEFEEIP